MGAMVRLEPGHNVLAALFDIPERDTPPCFYLGADPRAEKVMREESLVLGGGRKKKEEKGGEKSD